MWDLLYGLHLMLFRNWLHSLCSSVALASGGRMGSAGHAAGKVQTWSGRK